MSELKPKNYCTTCGKDFTSLEGFDDHRVGAHEPGEYRGDVVDWTPQLGRRCLDSDELAKRGYEVNARGEWFHVERAERTREYFRKAS